MPGLDALRDLLRRFDAFNILALLVLVGMVLFLGRSGCGAALGVNLSPGGYVRGVAANIPSQGSEREVIEFNDRVTDIAGRPVNSLAEIGAVLRTLDPSPVPEGDPIEGLEPRLVPAQVPVTLERYAYRYVEILSHQTVSDQGFPSTIENTDRVVGYDGREVSGDVDLAFVSEELERNSGKSITFIFERPVHRFTLTMPLVEPPLGLWPAVLFAVALAVVIVIGWRSRNALTVTPGADPWLALALASLTLPWALLLLGDPVGALRDPVLLFFGLTGLAFYRPLMLELHRRLKGADATASTAVFFLPALVVAFLGLFLVIAILPSLWGGTVSAEEEYQIAGMIQVSAGVMVAYHLVDMAIWFRKKAPEEANVWLKWPQLGLLISSLAIVTSVLHLGYNADAFLGGSFVMHAAALVLVLWLFDLSLLVAPPGEEAASFSQTFFPATSEEDLLTFFREVALVVHPDDPVLVVARGKVAWRIEADALSEMPKVSVRRAADTLRDGIGVFRDERLALPVHHSDEEPSGSVEVVQGVAAALGISTAFGLLDEADQLEGLDHAQRERVFFVFCIIEGGSYIVQPHEMVAIRERFASVWPQARHLIVETIFEEASAKAPAPSEPSSPDPADAPDIETPTEDRTSLELFAELSKPKEERESDEAPASPVGERAPEQVKVEVREVVREVRISSPELPYLRRDLAEAYPVDEMDLLEHSLEKQIESLVASDAPVIVVGPTGIGKEFAARRIYAGSRASEGPFIKFNVSTCPPSLRALELLGEGPGEGHLGAASGGVLFVEDAAELEEAPLTRLLKESSEQGAPVRLVLSVRTHPRQPPKEAVDNLDGSLGEMARGMFSHRLLLLDPLHARPQIVRSIVDYYLHALSMKHNRVITEVSLDAVEAVMKRRWPGGIAELKAVLEAAVLRCDGDVLEQRHLALGSGSPKPAQPSASVESLQLWVKTAPDLREALWRLQEMVYLEALEREEGNKSAAARLVGVKRTTFIRRLKEHGRFED